MLRNYPPDCLCDISGQLSFLVLCMHDLCCDPIHGNNMSFDNVICGFKESTILVYSHPDLLQS